MDTLVLSDSYVPMRRISWQDAICDVLSGRAEMIESYSNRVVRTATEVFPMPSIIRFTRKVRGLFKRSVKFNRKNVWLRDNGRCQYCNIPVGLHEYEYEHVIPQSVGGPTDFGNIVASCHSCNQKKSNRTPAQAGMKLLSVPKRPKELSTADLPISWGEIPDVWRDYLGDVSVKWTDAPKK